MSKLPPCNACGEPATMMTNERVIAACARHGRPVPQVCDACAWKRIDAALSDGAETTDYEKPPPRSQRERATHTTIGGRGVVGRLRG